MAWCNKKELGIFKKKTTGKSVIFGRNTYDNLPVLKDRDVYCLSRDTMYKVRDEDILLNNIEEVKEISKFSDVVICGGLEIYKYFLENNLISKIYISILNDDYDCDVYFPKKLLDNFVIVRTFVEDTFMHYEMEYSPGGEIQYLNKLENILINGIEKRGRNGITKSVFGEMFKFNLLDGFPLLTTKKMFFRGIVEEFIFFLKGETNTKKLEDKGINIWKGNTDRAFLDSIGKKSRKEGMMGPMYGYQFRSFGAEYNEDTGLSNNDGIDQLSYVINLIKNEPNSRRMIMTSYNPVQVNDGVLFPCHSLIIQFYVEGDYLDMYAMSRSADMFLGIPFNIGYYSLFLHTVASITGKIARSVMFTTGDTHIYEEHYKQVKTQINRLCYKFPFFSFRKPVKCLEDLNGLEYNDFILSNYVSHKKIKASMKA
jgi:thymidylate synthase